MNIFYLDKDPIKSAKYHCDQHCVKMIIEYAQIMSTTHRVLDGDKNDKLYRKTHMNYPSTVWCRQSSGNYKYLYTLFCALCDEFTKRYGKIHLTDKKLRAILKTPPQNIPKGDFFEPPCAMPEEYIVKSTVQSYRNFYLKDKVRFAKWKNGKPKWFK
jgi:hypothetical protein